MKDALEHVLNGQDLSEAQSEAVFSVIMSGEVEPLQVAAFLAALRSKGEAVSEITGAARVMRRKAATIKAPEHAVDTAGTGGDGLHTYNISTAAAIVTAAAGVPVAKHGNKAISSKSGSADVLAALGVDLDASSEQVAKDIEDIGIGFLYAVNYHKAMAHVAPIRKALGTRTIFNILGPLSNPAGTKRQVIGVFDEKWLAPLAQVAGRLGAHHVWVVHGADGLDELSTTGPSQVAEWKDGHLSQFTIDAADYGLAVAQMGNLRGGDAQYNAAALKQVLAGEKNAYYDMVVLNAGAAIHIGGKSSDLKAGIELARKAIESGAALKTLENWASRPHSDNGKDSA